MFKINKQHFSRNSFIIILTLLFCSSFVSISEHQKQYLAQSHATSAIDIQSNSDIADLRVDWQSNITNELPGNATNDLVTIDSESVSVIAPQTEKQSIDVQTKAKVLETYGQMPLHFEPNNRQIDNRDVQFTSRGQGYNLFLSPTKATLALRQAVNNKINQQKENNDSENSDSIAQNKLQQLKTDNQTDDQKYKQVIVEMQIVGANEQAQSAGTDELESKSNYFIGNDKSKWRTGVANYKRVKFDKVYKGINLEYYGNQIQLEYDFVVEPNADPEQIKLKFAGVRKVSTDVQSGELILKTKSGEVRQKKPFVYQTDENGQKTEVISSYKVKGNQVSFQLGEYDKNKQLVIDPVVLVYSSFLGGSNDEGSYGIAIDNQHNVYVTGTTSSLNFPLANSRQSTLAGGRDIFITKINSTGSALVYSTYLGGSHIEEGSSCIAVDTSGNAYVTGHTKSVNFPTANAIQTVIKGQHDAFITKIDSTGSTLVYSTYLGGDAEDYGSAIAVDTAGNAYVSGSTQSTNFPTANAIKSILNGQDAFITKINSTGSALVYSTYLGGSGFDSGQDIAVDSTGNTYITGTTTSTNFPTIKAKQAAYGGGDYDAFITKINTISSEINYSTYLGGNNTDYGWSIEVDGSGNAYVTGQTDSIDFPVLMARQGTFGGGSSDAFITKIKSSGTEFEYSTYHGGSGNDRSFGIAVDNSGNAYISGDTSSATNFPLKGNQQSAFGGGYLDAFISKVTWFDGCIVRRAQFDFDGDSKTDISIYRPAQGQWWYLRSSDAGNRTFQFGSATDKLVPADYTGDGKTDLAVWRPQTGEWFIMRSEDSSFYSFQFGAAGDIPAPADFDADERVDAAVFRSSNSTWYIFRSTEGAAIQAFGQSGDVPVVADYDGDCRADIAVYRPSNGEWRIQRSSLGSITFQFGNSTDKPAQGDFTGDGKADVAFWRPQTGEWFVLRSENQSFYSFPFGTAGDIPSPGDYDGDGKSDAAVFRPSNNTWFIQRSSSGTLIHTFGQIGDKPVPNAFIP